MELRETGPVIHSHHFLQRVEAFPDREARYRFVVVGGGQSAGEIFEYLMDHYPNADVTATIRGFAYQKLYHQKVLGNERCRLLPFLELERLHEKDGVVEGVFRDVMQDTQTVLEADGLVLCTGYVWRKEHPLLDTLAPWFLSSLLAARREQR